MSKTIFNLVKNDKDELDKEFYSDNTLMSNYKNFKTNLKRDEIENNLKVIQNPEAHLYYDNQSVRQIFHPLVNDGIYRHIVAFYCFQRIYMDSMYIRLENSTLAFINIIDLFSKYAYSKLFLIKAKTQAVKSIQAVETLKGFIDEISNYGYNKKDIGEITLDGGSEFLGDMTTYLNKEEILNTYANSGDKLKTSPIERFNRTLRGYLEKYKVIYGKIDSNVLQRIINSYNGVIHAGLDYSPIEILKSKKDQLKVEQHFLNLSNENHINALKIGQEVRILINRSPFQKIKPVWSSELYKISKIINGSNYELEHKAGFFHLDELQVVNKDFLLNQKKVHIIKDEDEEPITEIKPVVKVIEIPVDKRESNRIRNPVNRMNL